VILYGKVHIQHLSKTGGLSRPLSSPPTLAGVDAIPLVENWIMRSRRQTILSIAAAAWLGSWAATVCPTDAQEATNVAAPAAVASGRRLNNFVTELLNLSALDPRAGAATEFENPRDGWVLLRSTASLERGSKLRVSVEPVSMPAPSLTPLSKPGGGAGRLTLAFSQASVDTQEGMRFLPAGAYRVRLQPQGSAVIRGLVVRAIPELIFCKFRYDPFISPLGPYDWSFVQKHVATNANCIVGSGLAAHREFVRSWKQQGKRWIVECGVPALGGGQPLTAEEAYAYWTQNVGFSDALLDGVIADEFLENRPGMKYPQWTEAVRRIRADDAFRGKFLYPYCTAIYRDPVSAEFLRTVLRSGYPFAWEVYLPEQPDEASARKLLEAKLAAEMRRWQAAVTNCAKQMVVCFGYMSLPTTETLNLNPAVDFKVWMDLQFQHVATEPAFQGLYGLMEYTCGYADEETVRWAARLYRHYGIEGNRVALSPALGFEYQLDHLDNPDFAERTKGWTVDAAEPGSVEAKSLKGYGWLQGRYPRTSLGDTFLWTKRRARKPNVIAQAIRRLQPGRLYSLKVVTADYQELEQGKSVPQTHAVSITLDGVAELPAKSIQYPIANNYAHALGVFNERNPAWMNYHFRLFRATGETARLALSDWAGPQAPNGPTGQELMFNFVELQPYFEE
jgi:hypothetical protein